MAALREPPPAAGQPDHPQPARGRGAAGRAAGRDREADGGGRRPPAGGSAPAAVLLKGGHLGGSDSPDLLLHGGEPHWLEAPRVPPVTRTAPAARWPPRSPPCSPAAGRCRRPSPRPRPGSRPRSPPPTGLGIGHGIGPVHHFHALWPQLGRPRHDRRHPPRPPSAAPAPSRPRRAARRGRLRWRMVTSWPRDLPGPGMNAQRLADRIGRLSGGRLTVQLFTPRASWCRPCRCLTRSMPVPPRWATAPSFYWAGKIKAAPSSPRFPSA